MSTLYVVATPLGNLEDLSPRACRILAECDVLFAEDTRRTLGLLQHLGISRSLHSLHEHNERGRIAQVLLHLEEGRSVALVSDAGTPVVSDPGEAVVSAALDAGVKVVPIAGPSALAAALSVSGFRADAVLFVGFLPTKTKDRKQQLDRISAHEGVVVLFESPHRIMATLEELASNGERRACLCRELTKMHEEVRRGTLADLVDWSRQGPRGEITLVLGPRSDNAASQADPDVDGAVSRCRAAGLSKRDTAAAVAAVLELPRKRVYARVEALDP